MAGLPEVLTQSRFYLELTLGGSSGEADATFLECKGFKVTQDVVDVCEVTSKGRIRAMKIPGNTKTNNITLRRGICSSQTLWQWFEKVQDGGWAQERRDGSITIYDQKSQMQARFQFQGAWPTSYTFPDVDANSTEYAIEELELVCEGLKRVQ